MKVPRKKVSGAFGARMGDCETMRNNTVIQSPDKKNFRKYGKIIEYPAKELKGTTRNLWRIVHTVPDKTGWRVAYLVLRDKTIGRMESHPTSDETFEPVKGEALIFLATGKCFGVIECFRLDKPVILKKGTWHGLISVSPEAEIKITENSRVSCRYWNFGFRIKSMDDLIFRTMDRKA